MRSPIRRHLLSLPNILSAARLPLAVAFPLVKENASALAIIGAAGITDLLDGWSARKLGQKTTVGAALDGFADKAFGVSLLVTLVQRGVLSPVSALLLATRELFELPLAARVLFTPEAQCATVDRAANRFGKVATALELAAVVAALARARVARPLVVAAGVAGAVAGISYWLRELAAERAWAAAGEPIDRPVPYLLAGGRPEALAANAA